MKKNRVILIGWILFWLLIWFLREDLLGLVIGIASLICVGTERVLLSYQKKQMYVQIETEETGRKNTPLSVRVEVENRGRCSVTGVWCTLKSYNLLTGERREEELHLSVPGRQTVLYNWKPVSSGCGKVELQVTDLRIFDGLGVFCAKTEAKARTAALVLPDLWPVRFTQEIRNIKDIESDEYSMYRSGDDPSEVYGLRDYCPGDRLQSIHWKLSEKTGHLMIREAGLPISDQYLIIMDNSIAAEGAQPSAQLRSCLGEAVVSISSEMCQKQCSHHIVWMNWETGGFESCYITQMDDLTAGLPELLAAGMQEQETTVTRQYIETAGVQGQIITVTLREDIEDSIRGAVTCVQIQGEEEAVIAVE